MTSYTSKYQPKQIEDFAGLRTAKKCMTKLTESPYQSAWLFVGPAGTGKTSMAFAVALELGAQVHHIASKSCNLETVESLKRDCQFVPMFASSPWHVVICDEADKMTPAAQLAFLSVLDGTEFPPNTIFIFTANDTKGLEDRFLSRTRQIQFDAPSDSLIAMILGYVWKSETQAAAPDVLAIAAKSKGNVRNALMTLEVEALCL